MRRVPVRFYIRSGGGAEVKSWSEVTTVSAPVSTSRAGAAAASSGSAGDVVAAGDGVAGEARGGSARRGSTLGDALESIGIDVGGSGGGGGDGGGGGGGVGGGDSSVGFGGGAEVRAVVQGVDVAMSTDLAGPSVHNTFSLNLRRTEANTCFLLVVNGKTDELRRVIVM